MQANALCLFNKQFEQYPITVWPKHQLVPLLNGFDDNDQLYYKKQLELQQWKNNQTVDDTVTYMIFSETNIRPTPIAYAQLCKIKSTQRWRIHYICVSKEYTKKGLAKKLWLCSKQFHQIFISLKNIIKNSNRQLV